jgi:hypothetical protein
MAGTLLSAPIELRARWYLQVDKYKKTVTDVCNIFGISRKSYYKWYNLDHALVRRTLKRRGIHPHTKLTPAIQQIIYACKMKYNYGPAKMRVFLRETQGTSVSITAIYKYYKKRRLIRKPQRKQPWYMPLREPYTASIPGENVQLDVKYVPGPDRSWRYQYRFLDTVTNLQYATETECKDARATIAVFKRAVRSFPFSILGIQTDNGSEFRGAFHLYLLNCRIVHRYIPKRSAPWNGKVERANRSIDDEYYLNTGRPWTSVTAYTHWYNHERYHLGKGMAGLTPYQKYLSLAETSVTLEG